MNGAETVLFSSGDELTMLERMEQGFRQHFLGVGRADLSTQRLGRVSSLRNSYKLAAEDLPPSTWCLFAHQDVSPALPPVKVPEERIPGLLGPGGQVLTEAVTDTTRWIRVAEELLQREETGFLGVAGALRLDAGLVWWNSEHLSGGVVHQDSAGKSRVNAYGSWGRVAVLDGLLLMCRAELLQKMELPVMEHKRFHFYDMELCLRAHLMGRKNWTIPLLLQHHSSGARLNDSELQRDLLAFSRDCGQHLPVEVPREALPEVA